MRILHTSDWHLGRTFHGRVLDSAHEVFADHLVELVDAEDIDAVLVSGDVYDRAVPPTASVDLLDDTLRRLTDRTRVVLTSGNHDSAPRLGFGSRLLRERLSIQTRASAVDRPICLPDAEGRLATYVYALPYLDPDGARESLPPLLASRLGEEPHDPQPEAPSGPVLLPRSHEAVVSAALRLVAADLTRRRTGSTRVPAIAMAHAFVVGGQASEGSERDIRVGGVDSVPAGVFAALGGSPQAGASGGLDYVALGHLHRPQEISHHDGPRLVYSGSPLPFSFPEAEVPKSSVLLELTSRGLTSLERLEAPCPYRAVTVTGSLEELVASTEARQEDWVRVILTGPMPPGTMARLKERFPHLLAFSWQRPQLTESSRAHVTRTSNPLEVTERFLTTMLERTPQAPELEVITQAYEAVRAAGKAR